MKLFGYEIKKIPKEYIVEVFYYDDGQIGVKLIGNGWLNPLIETTHWEFPRILNGLPNKLSLDEKIDVLRLIFPDDVTFKIVEK